MICKVCNEEKGPEEFYACNKSKCKKCLAAYHKEYMNGNEEQYKRQRQTAKKWREDNHEYDLERKKIYNKNNPEIRAATAKRKREKMQNRIIEFKLQNPCPCGIVDPAYLELHHRNKDEKEFTIGKCRSWVSLEAELKKCDVLCQHCHTRAHGGVPKKPMRRRAAA